MKKLFLSVLLLPVLAWAQNPVIVEKPLLCAKTTEILTSLREKYEEHPLWIGKDDKSNYSLFVSKVGTWTLIQFTEEVACILGVGTDSKEIIQGPKI